MRLFGHLPSRPVHAGRFSLVGNLPAQSKLSYRRPSPIIVPLDSGMEASWPPQVCCSAAGVFVVGTPSSSWR
jgi:hypothetical protein